MSAFQVGGAVRGGAPYVTREADTVLLARLRAMELCYVLAARQLGKSSLRVRVASALRGEGLAVATVDLSALGTAGTDPAAWMFSVVCEISDALGWADPAPGWAEGVGRSPSQRWLRALWDGLSRDGRRVVIFLDEIDVVRTLPFSGDDFFAAIRAVIDLRASDPAWQRLTFCLLGVVSPSELIADPRRTPFNVGVAVALADIREGEANALLPALASLGDGAPFALGRALHWTSGHPFQTNQILDALLTDGGEGDLEARVDRHVHRLFFASRMDPGMEGAAREILASGEAGGLLALYRRLCQGEEVVYSGRDPVQLGLRLSGLAAEQDGLLRIRNRIFARVFDADWVDVQLNSRVIRRAALAWRGAGSREEALPAGAELARLEAAGARGGTLEREELEFLVRARARDGQLRVAHRMRQVAGAAGLLGLALVLALWVAMQSREEAARLSALRTLSQTALQADSPGHSADAIRAALDAWSTLADSPLRFQATRSLLDTLVAARGGFVQVGGSSYTLVMTPEGPLVGGQHEARQYTPDLGSARALPELGAVRRMAMDRGTGQVLVGTIEGSVLVWDLAERRVRARFPAAEPNARLTTVLRREDNKILGGIQDLGFDSAGDPFWIGADGQLYRAHADEARVVEAKGVLVRAVALPDRRIAAITDEGLVLVVDPAGAVAASFGPFARVSDGQACAAAPPEALLDLARAPDGRHVAVVGRSSVAVVLDLTNGAAQPLAETGCITRVAWVGDTLVTSRDTGSLGFWSAQDGTLRVRRLDLAQGANVLVGSPDGRMVALGGYDDVVSLWDVSTGSPLWFNNMHERTVMDLAFSADGRLLYSVGDDGRLAAQPVGSPVALASWTGGPGRPSGLDVNEDLVAVAWTEAPVQLIPARPDGDAPWEALRGLVAEDVHFSGDTALVSSVDGTLIIRAGGKTSGPFPGRTMARFSPWRPDGQAWVSRDTKGTVYVRDLDGRELVQLPAQHSLFAEPVFSPDGNALLLFGPQFEVSVYGMLSGLTQRLGAHRETIAGGTWSPEGDAVLTLGWDNMARVFDVRRATQRLELPLSGNGWVGHWLAEPARLIVTQQNRRLSFYTEDGERTQSVDATRGTIRSAQLSPDGRILAISSEDGAIGLWDTRAGELVGRIPAHASVARLLRFSSDGRTLWSAGDDGVVVQLPASAEQIVALACNSLALAGVALPEVCAPRNGRPTRPGQ